MKKILLAILTLFLIHCVSAQTNTFTAISGGWNSTGNWSLGVIPTSSHDVVIPSGTTVSGMSAGSVNVCKTLTVSGTLTFSGGNPRYITVSGNVVINSGGVINMTGSNQYYIDYKGASFTVASGATLTMTSSNVEVGVRYTGTIASTITNNSSTNIGSLIADGTGTLSSGSSFTLTKALTVSGTGGFAVSSGHTVTLNAASVCNTSRTLTVNSGGTLATAATFTNSGSMNINGTFQINQGGWATGSNFTYGTNGTLAFNNSSGGYGVGASDVFFPTSNGPKNVSVLGAGGVNFNSITRTISGTFIYNYTISNYCNITYAGSIIAGGSASPNPMACGTYPTYVVHVAATSAVSNDCTGASATYWNVTPSAGAALVLKWNIENKLSWTQTGIYYTTDGSDPSGNHGVGFGTTQYIAGSWICTDGSNREIATGTIPSGVNVGGVTVKYKIGTWYNATSTEAFATSTYLTQTRLGNIYSYTLSCTNGTWLGTTSTDWATSSNWSCGVVPTSSIDVTIPNTVNKPNINAATTANVKSLTINSGATLTMNGGNLNIASGGTLLNNGTFTTAASVCTGTVNFAGGGTITGDCTFPNLTFSGTGAAVTCNSNVTVKGNLTEAFQHINTAGKSFIFTGDCSNDQTITRTGSGTVYFKSIIINQPTANFVILSNSPATNVSIDDPLINNASGTTLTINNAGGLDINGQTFTINGGGGGGGAPRAAILVNGATGGTTKTIKSSVVDGTFNIRGTFIAGIAGVEVNSASSGKLLFANYVNVNTNIGYAPTDITTIGYKLELLGVASYNGGFVADINNTNSAIGHPVYAVGSTLIYNNVVGTPFDRNREWDASGVQTAGVTPGYPYNVLIKGNSKVDIGINTTSGIDNRAVANDLTIEAGSTLDMNVMDQTNHHLTVGRDLIFAGTLMLGHGTTSNNPFVGDILVGRNWTRTGTTSIFNANETGSGYTAANKQTVISDVITNIKARAVTFFGTDTSIISAPVSTTRDINGGFDGETFPYLKVNKTTNTNVVTNNNTPITITRVLSLTRGKFNLGDSNVVMVSNLYRTADVASINPSDVTINYDNAGRFIIQRFIYNQSTQRSWRFLTAPFQASDPLTINDAWQEGVVNPVKTSPSATNPWPSRVGSWCGLSAWPGLGTHITGVNGVYDGTKGFDQGTNTFSIEYFDNSGATNTWVCPANTKSTTLMSKSGWGLFVRGDRGFVIGDQYVPAATTILEPKGKINVGDVTTAVVSGKTNLVGNPYASQINMTNVSVGGLTKQNFKLWDPKAFTSYTNTGKYIPFTWVSGTTYAASMGPVTVWTNPGTVESSQAFFVTPSGSTVVFHETDKVSEKSTMNGIQSRPVQPSSDEVVSFFRTNLSFESSPNMYTAIDGTLNLFNSSYNSNVDMYEDVVSPVGSQTGALRIIKDGFQLAISKEQSITTNDTVFYFLSKLNQAKHMLTFTFADFMPASQAVLYDRYKMDSMNVTVSNTETTNYLFDITSDIASNRSDRFMLVFKPESTLPVKIISANISSTVDAKNKIDWDVAEQTNVSKYVIERSLDGTVFLAAENIPVVANNFNYSWIDNTANAFERVYYRVGIIDIAGKKTYSRILIKNMVSNTEFVRIYPNPVKGNDFAIQLNGLKKEEYIIRLINAQGQLLMTNKYNFNEGSNTLIIKLPSTLSKGKYFVEVYNKNELKGSTSVVVE